MLQSFRRGSHLILALCSAIFLLLATGSGLILAFEPIYVKSITPYSTSQLDQVSVAQLLDSIGSHHDEILEITIDQQSGFRLSTFEGEFNIDPYTGRALEFAYDRPELFSVVTNFHRSLFLKTAGRLMVGICSGFLFLIAITGLLLAIKKLSLRKFFLSFENSGRHPYHHTYWGRLLLVPIVIIAVTGVILSLVRFNLIETKSLEETAMADRPAEENFFESIYVDELVKLEYPFSDAPEDVYVLNLHDRALEITNGDKRVAQTTMYPSGESIRRLSFNLHTGWNSSLWALVLGLACFGIFYFMYSGLLIAYRRLARRTRNALSADQADTLILVGSENGKTHVFARILYEAMREVGRKVFVDDLNNVALFPNTRELIILTSTYGEGEPPSTANKFIERIAALDVPTQIHYSVLGFGSTKYAHFCQFARDVEATIQALPNFNRRLPAFFIDQNKYADFKKWISDYSSDSGLKLNVPQSLKIDKKKQYSFEVVNKREIDDGGGITFFIELYTKRFKKFRSGDLIAFRPGKDDDQRMYSVGKLDNGNLFFAIKLHEQGMASRQLFALDEGDKFRASHVLNSHFHLPDDKKVVMIANGTGVAPFIGMISGNTAGRDLRLIWGVRNRNYTDFIGPLLKAHQDSGRLSELNTCYSNAEGNLCYVQDVVVAERTFIASHLKNGQCIMICGSLAMQKGVFSAIDDIMSKATGLSSEHYVGQGQILVDCY